MERGSVEMSGRREANEGTYPPLPVQVSRRTPERHGLLGPTTPSSKEEGEVEGEVGSEKNEKRKFPSAEGNLSFLKKGGGSVARINLALLLFGVERGRE